MDIKQLRFLIALDETRHFGQAAARCHVTQPTLSMRLRGLEDELGVELVRRGQRFEGFTEAGQRILAWARTLMAAHDGPYAEAQAFQGQLVGTLRVGLVPLASALVFDTGVYFVVFSGTLLMLATLGTVKHRQAEKEVP